MYYSTQLKTTIQSYFESIYNSFLVFLDSFMGKLRSCQKTHGLQGKIAKISLTMREKLTQLVTSPHQQVWFTVKSKEKKNQTLKRSSYTLKILYIFNNLLFFMYIMPIPAFKVSRNIHTLYIRIDHQTLPFQSHLYLMIPKTNSHSLLSAIWLFPVFDQPHFVLQKLGWWWC